MAKSNKAKPEAADRVIRPINPFMTSLGITCGWAAYHIPHSLSTMIIVMFAAKAVAFTVVGTGILVTLMEFIFFASKKLAEKIKLLLPTAQ